MTIRKFKLTELRAVGIVIVCYALLLVSGTVGFDPSSGITTYDLGLYGEPQFWVGLLVEGHGFLLDLLILGFVVVWVNKILERRRAHERYQEEIDDFRPWKTVEASFKIAGCVRRLAKDGVKNIDLYECYLKRADLRNLDLSGAKLWGADMGEAILKRSILAGAKMKGCYLAGGRFSAASFEGAYMTNARCKFGDFSGCKFSRSTLIRVNFVGANLRGADLSRANVTDAVFESADLTRADLRGAVGLCASQLLKAKCIKGVRVSSHFAAEFANEYPHRVDVHTSPDGVRFINFN